jgi:hypothetical protein
MSHEANSKARAPLKIVLAPEGKISQEKFEPPFSLITDSAKPFCSHTFSRDQNWLASSTTARLASPPTEVKKEYP